jgi:arginyl-tRNA--protein-N-Asp/Glu arginylyltransferase
MLALDTFVVGPEECPYLPDQQSTLEYKVVARLSGKEYEDLMNQGYRKFGPLLFHPVCPSCQECRPLRIDVARFAPDRSQKRTLKRNSDLEIRFAPPTVDDARLDLYHRYHASQEDRKGWPAMYKDASDYAFSFIHSPVPGIEISLWEEGILRAIVLTEITPNVVSGVYHFHDPEISDRGLGTFGMLHTIELARQMGKPWAYFGYYVADCRSLNYKSRFRPCELLYEDGVWRPYEKGEI